jgi:hypothetical protein
MEQTGAFANNGKRKLNNKGTNYLPNKQINNSIRVNQATPVNQATLAKPWYQFWGGKHRKSHRKGHHNKRRVTRKNRRN